jgi:putative pyrroloquinoline-quinone binding quinoprotein
VSANKPSPTTAPERAPCRGSVVRAFSPDVLVCWWKNTYFGYDRHDLSLLWEFKLKESTSTYDRTYFTLIEGAELKVGDIRTKRLERRDLRSGDLIQGLDLTQALGTGLAVPGRVLATPRKGRQLLSLSLGDDLGEEQWRVKLPRGADGELQPASEELVFHGNRVVRVTDGSEVRGLRNKREDYQEGRVLSSSRGRLEEHTLEGEPCWLWAVDPEVSRIESALFASPELALVQHTLKTVTRTETPTGASTSVAVTRVLKGVDRETGDQRWERAWEDKDRWRVVAWREWLVVYLPGSDGHLELLALDPSTGQEAWTASLDMTGWGPCYVIPHAKRLEVLGLQSRSETGGRRPVLDAEFVRYWLD